MQLVAYMTITELQNADDLLNSLTVGDVVTPDSSKIVKALKDCKLKDIGTKINTLKIDDVIDINDSSSIAMKSLAAHGATLENIDTIVNELSIGELIEITYDQYAKTRAATMSRPISLCRTTSISNCTNKPKTRTDFLRKTQAATLSPPPMKTAKRT